MQLVIMRHAEAEPFASSDEQRNLTEFGRVQATAAGRCLQQLSIEFDQVWVSPYKRTQQTADLVLAYLPATNRKTANMLLPESSPDTVLDCLESSTSHRLLLISHQPLVSILVALLESGSRRDRPSMSPATMALLSAEQALPGCCQLLWMRHSPEFEAVY